jgi:CRP-like cAMP-binding protein
MDSATKRFDLNFIEQAFNPIRIELNKGEVLFKEGEDNDFVFFIESGSIKVLKGKWVIGITQALEFVGITSCLSETSTYTFSSKAVEKSVVLKISKNDFKNMLLCNSFFCKQIIEILCERIKLTDLKTRTFIEQTSQHRLINELINNSKSIENSLKTFLGVEDLSELTGISKRAVKKMLNDLSKQNLIIQSDKDEIELLDQIKLRQLITKKEAS